MPTDPCLAANRVYTGWSDSFLAPLPLGRGGGQCSGGLAANTQLCGNINVNESRASGKSTCAYTGHS